MPCSSPPRAAVMLMRSGPGRPNFGFAGGGGRAGIAGPTGRPATDGNVQAVGRSTGRAPGTGARAGFAGVMGVVAARAGAALRARIAPVSSVAVRVGREVTAHRSGRTLRVLSADGRTVHPGPVRPDERPS